ncbi:Conserved_hypothetical protein [Hexamita inflata]|uniref:Uncharacterized protein n=1 Tax=Hexamita inflata TaxID=28002 RepID=A0AA86UGB4_9EUKA|nr:Conserved hypothetical protein [Hexamita inflata]
MIFIFISTYAEKSFKQCFSPASTITGNRLTRTITLTLLPNPLIKFIPTDNMCQVLNGKSSTAKILLNSAANGKIQIPATGLGIPFVYQFNQEVKIQYQVPTITEYDLTLDAQYGGFSVLLDGEYEVVGSVSDVFHVLSNQTSCFSSARFTFSLPDWWFAFEVEPVFCDVTNYKVFFEYQTNNRWLRVPVKYIENANIYAKAGDYADGNQNFLNIKRYLIDVKSATENTKYTSDERDALKALVLTLQTNVSTPIRLSLDYLVKTTTASITTRATYIFSDNQFKCLDSINTRSTINENGLVFKTGYLNSIPCFDVSNTDPKYAIAQYIKQNAASIILTLVVTSSDTTIKYKQNLSLQSFAALPLVQFSLPKADIRKLIDSDQFSNSQTQLFVQIFDAADKYLLDFTSKPVELKRTCVNQRVFHLHQQYSMIAVWNKELQRCKDRPVVTTTVTYTAMKFINGLYERVELYNVQQTVNYSNPIIYVNISCENIVGDKDKCYKDRENNMKTKERDKIIYFSESASELAQIQYVVLDTDLSVWTNSLIVFGGLILFTAGFAVYLFVNFKQ